MKDLIPKNGLVGSSNIAIIDTIDPSMEVKVVGKSFNCSRYCHFKIFHNLMYLFGNFPFHDIRSTENSDHI